MKKIELILPGFSNVSRNEILINIYKHHPHITMNDTRIHSFYGNFPSCNWNGGRLCLGKKSNTIYMKKIRNYHNNNKIAIALTMTNGLIDNSMLEDKYCNKILKLYNNNKNEVLVTSIILENYIRKKYKKIKINKSITSKENPLLNIKKYNLSLIPSQHSNDVEYLTTIPNEYRNNVEILCNDPCVTNCKYKYQHYEELANLQIGNFYLKTSNLYANCKQTIFNKYESFFQQRSQTLFVTPNKIRELVEMGYCYFKINGREKYKEHGYENIIYYCIREDYQLDVLCYMLERMILEYQKDVDYQIKENGFFVNEDQAIIVD